MTPLAGQLAVVTGAGSGIGKAIALALGRKGAALVLVGRRLESLDSVSAETQAAGIVSGIVVADLAQEDEVSHLCTILGRDYRHIDILVHSAATIRMGTFVEASADDFTLHYRTNLLAPYQITRRLLPVLTNSKGQIVFINSSLGLAARANLGQYAATKHALKAVADTLRDEVNRHGVRVLSVFPGRTATPTQQRIHLIEGRPYRPERLLQPEDVAEVVVHALCLSRTAEVTEIKIRPMLGPDQGPMEAL